MWIICFLAPVILSVDSAAPLFPVLVFHDFLQTKILGLYCPRWGGFTRWWCQSHSLLWGECLALHGRCAGMAGSRASPPLTCWSFICINCFHDLLDFSGLFLLWAGSPGVKLEPVAAQEVQQESEAQQGKLPLWQQQLQGIRLVSWRHPQKQLQWVWVQPYLAYMEINFLGYQNFAPKGIFWDIPRRCVAVRLSWQAESLKRQHCGIT